MDELPPFLIPSFLEDPLKIKTSVESSFKIQIPHRD